tara:strand:+ start:212 stop:844 length:633 start_codon:yes stop_codon:yes gene_type:complete
MSLDTDRERGSLELRRLVSPVRENLEKEDKKEKDKEHILRRGKERQTEQQEFILDSFGGRRRQSRGEESESDSESQSDSDFSDEDEEDDVGDGEEGDGGEAGTRDARIGTASSEVASVSKKSQQRKRRIPFDIASTSERDSDDGRKSRHVTPQESEKSKTYPNDRMSLSSENSRRAQRGGKEMERGQSESNLKAMRDKERIYQLKKKIVQ